MPSSMYESDSGSISADSCADMNAEDSQNSFAQCWHSVSLPTVPVEALLAEQALDIGRLISIDRSTYHGPDDRLIPLLSAHHFLNPYMGYEINEDAFYQRIEKIRIMPTLPLIQEPIQDEKRDIEYYTYQQSIMPLPVQLAPYESPQLLFNDHLRKFSSTSSLHRNEMSPIFSTHSSDAYSPTFVGYPKFNDFHTLRKSVSDQWHIGAQFKFPWHSMIQADQERKYFRVYRCKQCEYVAKSKEDYWSHARVHIKAHKQLSCPKCLFVTEHKHHLEYHLRNHFGSKPFKCAKCEYTCVNNSMLKSHMKSHTNHRQYRCADCQYATKYCHSLKLHLKKRAHKAANESMLNANLMRWANLSKEDKAKFEDIENQES